MSELARVLEQHKHSWVIECGSRSLPALIRTGIRKRMTVYPGDLVEIQPPASEHQPALIVRRLPRRSFLTRPAVANVELLCVVVTIRKPPLDLSTLDRLLFCAAMSDIAAAVVFNKVDLLDESNCRLLQDLCRGYAAAGFPVVSMSAHTAEGLDALRVLLAGKLCCLAGKSGVGKSAITACLFPGYMVRVGELSAGGNRGTHTTTTTTLLPLPCGGYLADSPGFSALQTPTVAPEQVALGFPEIVSRMGQCRYRDCSHREEPGCAVRREVEAGMIMPGRYDSYLVLRREMEKKRR